MFNFTDKNVKEDLEIDVDGSVSAAEPVSDTLIGVVTGCKSLNIRTEPAKKSNNVVCVVDTETVVIIDLEDSTDEWYKVFTEAGAEGFCMKEFVKITG